MNSIYFAYGSNMSAAQMQARCPGVRLAGIAAASSFRLAFDRYSPRWQGHVADLRADPGSRAWGVIWRVTPAHLATLDGFEGVASGAYRRHVIGVTTPGGHAIEAVTYRVVAPAPEGPPAPGYIEVLRTGAREHGLPAPYQDYLARIASANRAM